jgi:hypothetical protein
MVCRAQARRPQFASGAIEFAIPGHSLNAIQCANNGNNPAKEWRPRTIHRQQQWLGRPKTIARLKTIPDLNFASSQVGGGFFKREWFQRAAGDWFIHPTNKFRRKRKARKETTTIKGKWREFGATGVIRAIYLRPISR